jgi:hypothetical protein
MSTIDNPKIIADLLKRKGYDKFEGAQITIHDPKDYGFTPPKTLLMGSRFKAETIWEYTSGFGTKCWKLIYGLYPNAMSEREASAIFLATANILPGSECRAILFRGELTASGANTWQSSAEKKIWSNSKVAG